MSCSVTVLTGGSTPERDVALAGAAQVVAALRERGYRVGVVDTAHGALTPEREAQLLQPNVQRRPPDAAALERLAELEASINLADLEVVTEVDVVFLVLHGKQGEGGDIQELLDEHEVVYTGSDPVGSRRAMDKDAAKRALVAAGVPTPAWGRWPVTQHELSALGLPLIVKPSRSGSTVGLSVVENEADLPAAVTTAQQVDDEIIVETYLPGRELTVGVLDGRALTVGEIIPQHEIFDYECKYTPGMTQELFPADVHEQIAVEVQRLGELTHHALALRDFSRVDFRLDDTGRPQCLEANTLPGMTATSLLPQSAAASGIPFGDLCERILELALRRERHGNKV
jgi:D-alanine-D-alanine ligase